MSPGYRYPGSKQYERVDCGQTPRPHGHEFLLDCRPSSRPSSCEIRPQNFMLKVAKLRNGKYPHVIQRAEECGKKHDFRKNEPAHSPAERFIYLLVEFAALALSRHGAKPDKTHVEENGEANCEQPITKRDLID